MYVEVGPAGITVSGDRGGQAFEFDREKLEGWIRDILQDVRECLPLLRQKAFRIKKAALLPEVARKMIEAVKMVDEATLTPMAAIAGAVADALKERYHVEDLDFISINNGGDISIGNRNGRPLRVGLGDINTGRAMPYALLVEGLKNCGIASSGFGGRSFTLGLADIVTVVGPTGAIADAAATFICNNTDAETNNVVKRIASDIDPLTDIPDDLVTVSIGVLNSSVIDKALENGLCIAHNIKNLNVINDAVIVLKGNVVTTIDEKKNIRLEVQNGD
jgi:ApbE superfamily uncharacterized protein (UPF0280 family)